VLEKVTFGYLQRKKRNEEKKKIIRLPGGDKGEK